MGASKSKSACCLPLGNAGVKKPITVAVAGVAGQIGYALLPMIAKGDMFGPNQPVIIKGLDLNLPLTRKNMEGIMFELEDCGFPLLQKPSPDAKLVHMDTDESTAFNQADYVILLGSWPPQESSSKKDVMGKNTMIFKTMGKAIDQHAKKDCKVVVFAPPCTTNALICSKYAPSCPKTNITAVTGLTANRAVAQLAQRAKVIVSDVKNVIIWGGMCTAPTKNITSLLVDTERCTIGGKALAQVLSQSEDKHWLEQGLQHEVNERGRAIVQARKASASMSAARAICDHVHSLHCGTSGQIVSMGIWTEKNKFQLNPSLYCSMPVTCQGEGQVQAASGFPPSAACLSKLKTVMEELEKEKRLAEEFFSKDKA